MVAMVTRIGCQGNDIEWTMEGNNKGVLVLSQLVAMATVGMATAWGRMESWPKSSVKQD